MMEPRKRYPDDLSDYEWNWIKDLLALQANKSGRKPLHSRREILNAIFYLLRTGCSWRHLPHEFPPWKSVYTQFRRWKLGKFFEEMHDFVREELRSLLNRTREPSAGIADSQSVKTTEKGG